MRTRRRDGSMCRSRIRTMRAVPVRIAALCGSVAPASAAQEGADASDELPRATGYNHVRVESAFDEFDAMQFLASADEREGQRPRLTHGTGCDAGGPRAAHGRLLMIEHQQVHRQFHRVAQHVGHQLNHRDALELEQLPEVAGLRRSGFDECDAVRRGRPMHVPDKGDAMPATAPPALDRLNPTTYEVMSPGPHTTLSPRRDRAPRLHSFA